MQKQIEAEILSPYDNFLYALKAKETKRQYPHKLDKFLQFMGFQGTIQEKCNLLNEFVKNNSIEPSVIKFINSQKERIENKEIAEGTLWNYIKAIKLFFSMNDIVINWKKLGKGIPSEKHSSEDRIPTTEEIKKLLGHPDRRLKPIVYTSISCGLRVGSWNHLQWKHVIPITRNNVIVAAKIILRNTKIKNRTYFSFITPEAYFSLKNYMEFREMHGEKITGESFLVRDTWQQIDRKHSHRIGLAQYPKKMTSAAIMNLLFL